MPAVTLNVGTAADAADLVHAFAAMAGWTAAVPDPANPGQTIPNPVAEAAAGQAELAPHGPPGGPQLAPGQGDGRQPGRRPGHHMTLRPFRYHVAVVFLDEDDTETTSQPVTVPAKNWDRFVADELPALVADTIANYQPAAALKPSAQPNRGDA